MVEELKKMFDFFYLRKGETKKEYKRRVEKRGTELLNGVDCSLQETINFIALCKCKANLMRIDKEVMSFTLTDDEIKLRKGNAKDYEKFVFARFFNYLDEKEFEQQKKSAWEEIRKGLDMGEFNREQERYHPYFEDHFFEKMENDEALIKEYGDLNADEQSRKINRKRFVPKK